MWRASLREWCRGSCAGSAPLPGRSRSRSSRVGAGRSSGLSMSGSAHGDEALELLLASARERLRPGQGALDLGEVPALAAGLDQVADWTSECGVSAGQQTLEATDAAPVSPRRGRRPAAGAGGQVVATSSLVLWQVLTDAYARLGFEALADEAFRAMVLARIIEPTSKTDSLRVLAEIGAPCPRVRTPVPVAETLPGQRLSRHPRQGLRRAVVCCGRPERDGDVRLHDVALRDLRRGHRTEAAAQGRHEQGTPRRPAGSGRAAGRPDRVPAGGPPVRGEHGRDHHHPAGPD